jgi:hypothetical protein
MGDSDDAIQVNLMVCQMAFEQGVGEGDLSLSFGEQVKPSHQ